MYFLFLCFSGLADQAAKKEFKLIYEQIMKMEKIPLIHSDFSPQNFQWIKFYKSAIKLGIEVDALIYIFPSLEKGNERDLKVEV